MTATLADMFAASNGGPVDRDGQAVHLWVEVGPLPASRLTVELDARPDRPQALCIEARGGKLKVAEQLFPAMVLWSDTAPPVIELQVTPTRGQHVTLRFWNAWKGTRDVMHSGVGNVGIRTEAPSATRLVLRCSDGWGPVDFDDLHVALSWTAS